LIARLPLLNSLNLLSAIPQKARHGITIRGKGRAALREALREAIAEAQDMLGAEAHFLEGE